MNKKTNTIYFGKVTLPCLSSFSFFLGYHTDGHIIVNLQIELITNHCLLSAINHWLYILFDLISSSTAARFQVKTLIEPRASCKYIIKQKETKKNTVTDDSSIENNKGPSERKHICGKGYKK